MVEDSLVLKFKYVDYQTLAHLSSSSYVCRTSAHARKEQRFLSIQASISASTSGSWYLGIDFKKFNLPDK